ncbi:MAG: hypothetical protein ACOY4U_04625 [Pseudomonadota bacterium]
MQHIVQGISLGARNRPHPPTLNRVVGPHYAPFAIQQTYELWHGISRNPPMLFHQFNHRYIHGVALPGSWYGSPAPQARMANMVIFLLT